MEYQKRLSLIEERRVRREKLRFKYVRNPHMDQIVNEYMKNQKVPKTNQSINHEKQRGPLYIVVTLLALGCLCYQLWTVTDQYMMYQTETSVFHSEPKLISMPGLAMCFNPLSLMKSDELLEVTNATLNNNDDVARYLTLQEVFNLTPNKSSIFVSCEYKGNDSFTLEVDSKKDCESVYYIAKYQKLQKLCYDFRSLYDYSPEFIMQGLEKPGEFYEFTFDGDLFKNVTTFEVIVHNQDFIPRGSELFPSVISRHGEEYLVISKENRSRLINESISFEHNNNETGDTNNLNTNETIDSFEMIKIAHTRQMTYNSFRFNFAIYANIFLPPPYPPNCKDYLSDIKSLKYRSPESCSDKCLARGFVKNSMNRIPQLTLVHEHDVSRKLVNGSLHVINHHDYANVTLIKLYRELFTHCMLMCKKSCVEKFYETNLVDFESSEQFKISLLSYKSFPFVTKFNPKLDLSQFVVQFLSCFGLWLSVDFTTWIEIYTNLDSFVRMRFQ